MWTSLSKEKPVLTQKSWVDRLVHEVEEPLPVLRRSQGHATLFAFALLEKKKKKDASQVGIEHWEAG